MERKKTVKLILVLPLAATGAIASFWFVWYLINGSVPAVTSLNMAGQWRVYLPFEISRWWDILMGPFWACFFIIIVSREEIREREKDAVFGSFFGLFIGLVFGLVYGVIYELDYGPGFGIFFGLIFGLSFEFVLGLGFGFGSGLFFGISFGLGFGAGFGLGFGLVYGVYFTLRSLYFSLKYLVKAE